MMTDAHPTQADRELWQGSCHGWTLHGHACCDDGPADDEDDASLCGGPHWCDDCHSEAAEMHGTTGGGQ